MCVCVCVCALTDHRLLCLLNKIFEVVILVLLKGSEDEIQHNLAIVLCPLTSLLLLLGIISLFTTASHK